MHHTVPSWLTEKCIGTSLHINLALATIRLWRRLRCQEPFRWIVHGHESTRIGQRARRIARKEWRPDMIRTAGHNIANQNRRNQFGAEMTGDK
jgi:hypothetical protein